MNLDVYFAFLDSLRESGSINMFGAPKVIQEVFGLSRTESIDVFTAWAENFSKES